MENTRQQIQLDWKERRASVMWVCWSTEHYISLLIPVGVWLFVLTLFFMKIVPKEAGAIFAMDEITHDTATKASSTHW